MSSQLPPAPASGFVSAPSSAPAQGTGAAAFSKPKSKTTTKKKTVTKATGAAATQAKAKKPNVKRKKPVSKASSVASNQAITNEARAAQLDLAQQRAQAAARKSDPLWYRIEDVLPAVDADGAGSAAPKSSSVLPEQSQILEAALAYNGLQRSDVTPQAMVCLLEQVRRYAVELITDANDYAYSANRIEVTRADLMLAAEMRSDHPVAVSVQLPKLNILAQQINRAPLPPIPSQCFNGVLLPSKEHQLTARTYDVVSSVRVAQKMTQNVPAAPTSTTISTSTTVPSQQTESNKTGTAGASSQAGSYGASRGRQIPIKMKQEGTLGN